MLAGLVNDHKIDRVTLKVGFLSDLLKEVLRLINATMMGVIVVPVPNK